MAICLVYARADGTIPHVWHSDIHTFSTPEDGATRVARFIIENYPAIYQQLADNTKTRRYLNNELVIDEVVIADAAWIAAREAEITSAAQIESDTNTLREFAALAKQHSRTIKALFLAITNADVSADNTAARFQAIASIIEDAIVTAPTFKNRFNTAFNAEYNINLGGMDLAALLALLPAQKREYIKFTRQFVVHYGLMLTIAT